MMSYEATPEDVARSALARAVTACEVSDDDVKLVAEHIVTLSGISPIRRLDICAYGICIDYLIEPDRGAEILNDLMKLRLPVRTIEWFPWGVFPDRDDLTQVHAEIVVDQLAAKVK
jgi:hypothetical protein